MDRFGHSYIYMDEYISMNLHGAQVQSLDGEVPPEEGMATHSNTLAWKISWREEPGGLQSTGLKKVRHVILGKCASKIQDWFWVVSSRIREKGRSP